MKINTAVICLGLLAPLHAALAEDMQFAFKGIALGSTEASLKRAFPEFECKDEKSAVADRICSVDSKRICFRQLADCELDESKAWNYAGAPARVSALFYEDSLNVFSISFSSTQFNQVAAAMKEKYGEPGQTELATIQTNAGVTHQNVEATWLAPGATLSVKKYSGTITDSKVTMFLASGSQEFQQRQARKNKDAAKKL